MSSLVLGAFDTLQFPPVRFLSAAAQNGPLQVWLFDCPGLQVPLAERRYLLEALRCVSSVSVISLPGSLREVPTPEQTLSLLQALRSANFAALPLVHILAASRAADFQPTPFWQQTFCQQQAIPHRLFAEADLPSLKDTTELSAGEPPAASAPARKKIIVTGCFDWLHSGHVRFFEEVSALGDLYVVVGNDANVRLLKGEGHPLFPQEERRSLAASIRYVKSALISSGSGWMDAEPEIACLLPDAYAVNEDGDKPEKRQFCADHGLEYIVLKRTPAPGLPRRSSTDLRGF